jgi:hypothetical protein
VNLALTKCQTENAQKWADKPGNEERKKNLWKKIAQHILKASSSAGSADVKKLLQDKKLKIEDLIQYFDE